jgi:hypothetical protein
MLIVDLHRNDGWQRISDLKEALKKVGGAEPSYAEQVYGDTRSSEPELNSVLDKCRDVLQNRRLVLLHCGSSQHCVPDVLDSEPLNTIPCLLYSGGVADPEIEAFAKARSYRCALIRDVLGLAGLKPDQKERVEATLRLILEQGKEPGVAVAMAYGDPDLEKILDDLYGKLVPGADLKELQQERDAALEKHYREKRGW